MLLLVTHAGGQLYSPMIYWEHRHACLQVHHIVHFEAIIMVGKYDRHFVVEVESSLLLIELVLLEK